MKIQLRKMLEEGRYLNKLIPSSKEVKRRKESGNDQSYQEGKKLRENKLKQVNGATDVNYNDAKKGYNSNKNNPPRYGQEFKNTLNIQRKKRQEALGSLNFSDKYKEPKINILAQYHK